MLPDFPDLKREMDEFLTRFLRSRVQFYEGVVSEVPQHTIHEGDENFIVRPDKSEDKMEMVRLEHALELKLDELVKLTLPDVLSRLDKIAKEIASKKSKYFFETLSKVAEKTGNVVNGKGQPLSAETMLKALEAIQVDFDKSGQIKDMTIVVSPSQTERAQEIIRELETNPEIKKKHSKIIEKKKEQWRAREAARTLVG